jgi:D-arabinose 1-dehydrogenase-like Zn-dependent alcohol dehydrogenase
MNELRNRIVQVSRFGGPEGLEVVEAPLPTPGRSEVRVRVLASGCHQVLHERARAVDPPQPNLHFCGWLD